VKTFGTVTRELLQLSDWLMEHGCSHVAMESTGVYWKPVWSVLESAQAFELVLANARSVKNVPGRKSDVSDSKWLADLLAHGLISPSFVPPKQVQETRDLSRTRQQLVREMGSHVQRVQKVLETANVKLSSVLSDVMGQSGRAILDAIVNGTTDVEQLFKNVNYRVRASEQEVKDALRGNITEHHRFMLKLHLEQIDHLENSVRELEARLAAAIEPFREKLDRIVKVVGLEVRTGTAVLAELGPDLSRFSSADKLVAWTNICPRMDESAGKHRDTRIAKGGTWLKPILIQAAWAAVRAKQSYFRKKYLRIKGRRGAKKAIVAVAASILRTLWHLLTKGGEYKDLGFGYEEPSREQAANRLVARLRRLGYTAQLSEAA
jgi:transposase